MNNVLIVANTSYAGMGPYVSEIVNDFLPEDKVYFLFRDYDDDFFLKNIKKELHPKSTFVKIPNTNWNTLVGLLINKNRLLSYIVEICKTKDIALVHFINDSADTYTRKMLKKAGVEVVSTVHDLQPHEAKKEWYKLLRHRIESKRRAKYVREGNNFITNSKNQERILKQTYPDKRIYYHTFPSLVTDIIKNGKDTPEELKGLKHSYILFFGRIEEYKGVSLLYETFVSTPELYKNYNLVIAGKGHNSLAANTPNKNVIFINRYIKDSEIAYLFKNARAVIYPYISATQSGVLTLAFYFGTPILASDVPFFKELIEEGKNGMLFRSGDKTALEKALLTILSSNYASEMSVNEKEYYRNNYTKGVQRSALFHIYRELMSFD